MTTTLSPSGLRFHEYTDPNWPDDLAYNIGRLNTTLLKVERMGDVNLGPLSYRDGLKWDASGSEYVNYAVMASTTTSSSSTTSSTASTTSSTASTTSSTASSTSSTAPGATTTTSSSTTSTSSSSSTTATFTTTTAVPVIGFTAKSVILDILDNYGDGTYVGPRSIDFWYLGSKITNIKTTDFTADATTDSGASLIADNSFDTSLVKTGQASGYQWLAAGTANQRLICVFNSPIIFDEIRINNGHNSGSLTGIGAQNTKIHFSTDAITSTVYDEAIANSTLIFDGVFDQHIASDVEDEKILVLLGGATTTTTTTTTSSTTSSTATPVPEFTAKSVILDIADGIGATYLGVRQIDFWYQGSKVTALEADYTAYSTNHYSTTTLAKFAFDTSTSKIGGGDANSNSWFSLQTSNMRLICVFDSPITFDEIRVNNFHNSGSLTNRGSKNVQINISTDAITSTVYDEAIANSTLIYNSTFDEHIASNVEDEQTLTLI